ncbi:MAG: tryptophan synthase subunit alpha [Rhodothermales bacterium]
MTSITESRLTSRLGALAERGEKALGMFVTSGFPDLDATSDVLRAIDAGGADFIELGMPFSDPLAEGVPIQRSSARALAAGVTMERTLAYARAFTQDSETPLLLMGYGNPVMQYGISNFFRDARSSGVQGVILPDVLPDPDSPFFRAASEYGVNTVCLVSPTTPDARLDFIDELSSGFVYAVSVTGVTGTDKGDADPILAYLRHVKERISRNPLLVGFGIRSADDVRSMVSAADGAIVGSALVDLVGACWDNDAMPRDEKLATIENFVRELNSGTRV